MAQQKRPQAPKLTSPRLRFVWPKLVTPDTKFNAAGLYTVQARGNAEDPEVVDFVAKLDAFHKQAEANAKAAFAKMPVAKRKELGKVKVKPFYTKVFDEKTEEETGEIEFKFKAVASGTRKDGTTWSFKPKLFDAKGAEITGKPQIWGGSEGKIAFEVGIGADGNVGYFIPKDAEAGLSLKLQAVQIIKLVSGGARDAAGFGFGAEEGYDAGAEQGAEQAEREDGDPGPSDEDGNGGEF